MKNLFGILVALSVMTELQAARAEASQYPIFDGQYYNGLFYPNIDILEWGEPLHLEFQIYQKDKPIEISGQTIEEGGKKVFVFAVDLPYRKERLCRRVLAPPTFKADSKLFFYADNKDKEMNNIIISAQPLPGYVQYKVKPYSGCVEVAAVQAPAVESEPMPARTELIRTPASQSDLRRRKDRFQSNPEILPKRDPKKDLEFERVPENFSWF